MSALHATAPLANDEARSLACKGRRFVATLKRQATLRRDGADAGDLYDWERLVDVFAGISRELDALLPVSSLIESKATP